MLVDVLLKKIVFVVSRVSHPGKAFAGKTATINSMLGETVLDVKPMADVAAKVSMVTRTAHSIALRVIDTPSLAEGDSVNQTVRVCALDHKEIPCSIFAAALVTERML